MNFESIASMTGFGRAASETRWGRFVVELRSVNNRFLDVSVSLPKDMAALEIPLRNLLKQRVARGKVDCRVRFTPSQEYLPTVNVNAALAGEYLAKLEPLKQAGVGETLSLEALLALPGILELTPPELNDEELWAALRSVVEEAAAALNRERRREGAALGAQLIDLAARMRGRIDEIDAMKHLVVERYRERLAARIEELQAGLSAPLEPGRLEVETALFADRCDISEELVRLRTHLAAFESMLRGEAAEPVGKNLEFVNQEFVREINTIGSKARDTEVTSRTLELKSVAEMIREQIQNIE